MFPYSQPILFFNVGKYKDLNEENTSLQSSLPKCPPYVAILKIYFGKIVDLLQNWKDGTESCKTLPSLPTVLPLRTLEQLSKLRK